MGQTTGNFAASTLTFAEAVAASAVSRDFTFTVRTLLVNVSSDVAVIPAVSARRCAPLE